MTIERWRRPETDDWARYGISRRTYEPAAGGSADATSKGALRDGDDPFSDYRSEGERARAAQKKRRRGFLSGRRSKANILGTAVAVGVIGASGLLFTVTAFEQTPPAPPPTAAIPSYTATLSSVAPIHTASSVFVVQLPFSAVIPSRDGASDDGTHVFAVGNGGLAVIDKATGRFVNNFGGGNFPSRVRKWTVDNGIWLSDWLSTDPYCGPDCWSTATTYRVDTVTGATTLKLDKTFLIGASPDGILVAQNGQISVIDPVTSSIGRWAPWKTSGEPRYGCASLWSIDLATSTSGEGGLMASLSIVDMNTGDFSKPVTLNAAIVSGPIAAEGQCWTMGGQNAASNAPVGVVWLNPDGTIFDTRVFAHAVAVIDSEFWVYVDGTVQRLDPSSGVPYGGRYQLPIRPSGGDVSGLFSAADRLCLADGDRLAKFDIMTGAAHAG